MKKNHYLSKIDPKELIKYGLNPYQWLSIEENDFDAKLVHIDDPDFKFKIIFDSINYHRPISSIEWIFE